MVLSAFRGSILFVRYVCPGIAVQHGWTWEALVYNALALEWEAVNLAVEMAERGRRLQGGMRC